MTADFLKDFHTSPHQKVKVAIADSDGILRGKYISRDKFLSVLEKGFGFCNVVFGWDCADVCYDNSSYTGWHTGYPDALAKIDPTTYRNIPWEKNTPFFLADFVDERGEGLGVCSRSLLKRVLQDLDKLGYEGKVGMEYEWFNFAETPDSLAEKDHTKPQPISPGMFGYSLIRAGQRKDFFHDLMDQLSAYDIPLEGLHTETGPGVYEAAITATDPLGAADRGLLFKAAVKEISHSHGIMPTFMARWHNDLPGSSGHIHQSLLAKGSTNNAFYDAKDPNGMSDVFKHYLAGLIKLLPEFTALLAPTVNSYKRLVEGFWAPTRANWGLDNRTTALRALPGSPGATRLEVRVGGADINPYLALSACLAAGCMGIRHRWPLTASPIKGNGYNDTAASPLPSSLEEAAHRLQNSEAAHEAFGSEFVDHFVRSRQWEWQQYKSQVTDWELKRYFEII